MSELISVQSVQSRIITFSFNIPPNQYIFIHLLLIIQFCCTPPVRTFTRNILAFWFKSGNVTVSQLKITFPHINGQNLNIPIRYLHYYGYFVVQTTTQFIVDLQNEAAVKRISTQNLTNSVFYW